MGAAAAHRPAPRVPWQRRGKGRAAAGVTEGCMAARPAPANAGDRAPLSHPQRQAGGGRVLPAPEMGVPSQPRIMSFFPPTSLPMLRGGARAAAAGPRRAARSGRSSAAGGGAMARRRAESGERLPAAPPQPGPYRRLGPRAPAAAPPCLPGRRLGLQRSPVAASGRRPGPAEPRAARRRRSWRRRQALFLRSRRMRAAAAPPGLRAALPGQLRAHRGHRSSAKMDLVLTPPGSENSAATVKPPVTMSAVRAALQNAPAGSMSLHDGP